MDVSQFEWAPLKNERLKKARNVSFEEILSAKLIGIESHPSDLSQKRMIFELRNYIWIVPFVKVGDKFFLKTIYPSRKYTKRYKRGEML